MNNNITRSNKKSIIAKTYRFFVFLILFQLGFSTAYAQGTKLNLNLENTSLKKVMEAVEKQTDYTFMYDASQFDFTKKINLSLKNESIDKSLEKLFKGTKIRFKIVKKQIVLSILSQSKKTITGTVSDENGELLPGANIQIKNGKEGTTTDFDGNYSLTISGEVLWCFHL